MDNLRKLLFLCLSVLQVIAEDYYRKKFNSGNGNYTGTIACTNSNISIKKISISDDNASCQMCEIGQTDVDSIKHNCNGFSNCSLDIDFNTTCLKEVKPYPYFNISYVCTLQKPLYCNFETSFCNWIKVNINRTKALDLDGIPNIDNTTQSGNGHYVFVKKQSSLNVLTLLKSQQIVSYIPKCLKFWYLISHATLEIYQKDNKDGNDMMKIWSESETGGMSSWTEGEVNLNGIGIYEIMIKGTELNNPNTLIAIDDIDVFNVPCENSSVVICNFETGNCGFTVEPKFDKKWERANAMNRTNRPLDHTTNSSYGHYMYFELNTIDHSTFETSIIVPQIVPKESRCFSFWYYTSRSNTSKLNIYGTDVNNTEHHLLTVSNTEELEWYSVFIDVPNIQNVTLRYSFTNQTIASIAVDDIYISDSACAASSDCKTTNDLMSQDCQSDEMGDNCHFALMPFFKNETDCLVLDKYLAIEYSCIDKRANESSTLLETTSESTDKRGYESSKPVETTSEITEKTSLTTETSRVSYRTSTTSQTTGINVFKNEQSETSNSAGTIAGVILGIGAIVTFVVVVLYILRRRKLSNEKNAQHMGREDANDYTGQQNIALQQLNVPSNCRGSYDDLQHHYNEQHYCDLNDGFGPKNIDTTHNYIAVYGDNDARGQQTVLPPGHDTHPNAYECLDPLVTGYNRMEQNQTKSENSLFGRKSKSAENSLEYDENQYSIVGPSEANVKSKTIPGIHTSENYAVLDPSETGFDRSNDMKSPYEMAKPVNLQSNKNTNEVYCLKRIDDPYDRSHADDYDSTKHVRHLEVNDNVYSHSVDNVYDSASQRRKKEENEDDYDHFIGQKTEDDYDISKPL